MFRLYFFMMKRLIFFVATIFLISNVNAFAAEKKGILDKIREDYGKPLRVNSGYRSKAHNLKVGGRVGSSHLKGLAVDFHCNNSADRTLLLNAIYKNGIVRVGIGNTFIHIDIDNIKPAACWLYN